MDALARLLVAVLFATAIAGASAQNMSVVDVAAGNIDFSTLVIALQTAGLAEPLAAEGPFTVFAPQNEAFSGAIGPLKSSPEEFLSREDLSAILQYHVVPGIKLMSRDIADGQELITLQGDTLTVSISDNGVVTINGASVIIPDLEATNGVVHVIGSVLLPPGSLLPSAVVDVATSSTDFSTLVAALEAADLAEALSGQGPFTVFAPSDAAFAIAISALGTTAEELLASEGLGDILMYHVVPGKVMSSNLVDGQKLTTLLGDTLVVSVAEGVVTKINGAAIVAADVEAKNGVVHAIDAVLLPPPPETVVEVISSSPEFLTLVAAVEAASLAEPLSAPGPFTVFAPSNLAFAADLSALNLTAEELLGRGDLSEILKYHVVPGKLMSSDLIDGEELTTLQGAPLTVNVADDGTVSVGGAAVVTPDLEAGNGVVHVINAVLMPPVNLPEPEELPVTLPAEEEDKEEEGQQQEQGDRGLVMGPIEEEEVEQGVRGLVLMPIEVVEEEEVEQEVVVVVEEAEQGDRELVLVPTAEPEGPADPLPETVISLIRGKFSLVTLSRAVKVAGLVDELSAQGPFTVFAPNNRAFLDAVATLGTNPKDLLGNVAELQSLLPNHVVSGTYLSSDLADGQELTALSGNVLIVSVIEGVVKVGEATVTAPDMEAENGVVHGVDAVLLPPTESSLLELIPGVITASSGYSLLTMSTSACLLVAMVAAAAMA